MGEVSSPAVRLYHITSDSEWRQALTTGEYRPAAFAREQFIHCSYAAQVSGVANRLFRNVAALLLLEIDRASLSCPVVDENLEGGTQLFPHVYGPLPVSAVRAVHPFPCGADGTFALPAALVPHLTSAESSRSDTP